MLDPVALDVLARYPADCRPLGMPERLGNAGGLSGARLWRFRGGRGRLALRAWPVGGPDLTMIRRIHGWLAELRELGVVPVPLPDRQGRTVVEAGGRLWQVEPWMPGAPDLSEPPAIERVGAGFATLAAVHARLARLGDVGPSPGLEVRLRLVEQLRADGFDELTTALSRGPSGQEVSLARRWVELARSAAPAVAQGLRRHVGRRLRRQPCLRDVRPEHLLFTGDRLTGLVDPGAMDVESPAADLARLIGEWIGPDRPLRSRALDAYAGASPLDAEGLALIDVFERSAALLIGGRWARWHFLENRRFEDPLAVRRGLERGVARASWLAAHRG